MAQKSPQTEAGCPSDTPGKRGESRRKHLLSLDALDGRTIAAKQARTLIGSMTADLGGDLTAGQAQLVQRAAILGAYVEDFEARWIAGEEIDAAAYLAAINSQRRVLATIGLQRRARNITPSVAEYVASIATEEEAA
jgi:hypothetical protein